MWIQKQLPKHGQIRREVKLHSLRLQFSQRCRQSYSNFIRVATPVFICTSTIIHFGTTLSVSFFASSYTIHIFTGHTVSCTGGPFSNISIWRTIVPSLQHPGQFTPSIRSRRSRNSVESCYS